MAQNTATKYNAAVVERYKRKSLTETAFSSDFEWDGVKTVNVTSVALPTMNNYNRAVVVNRFGTPTEVDTTGQALSVTQDRGAEQIVDYGNLVETQNAAQAAKHLKRVIDERIVPEIDTYRLQVLATYAEGKTQLVNSGVTSASNAYDNFLALNAKLNDALVPITGRTAFMTSAYYNFLKTGNFTLSSDKGQQIHSSGVVGQVDGVDVVVVPTSWMPKVATGTKPVDCIIVHKDCAVGPIKLKNYRVIEEAQGIDGNILQWRYLYDAFVLDAKSGGVVAHQNAA